MPSDNKERREWLASHGLPHDNVEGDMLLEFIADQCRLARLDERSLALQYMQGWKYKEDYKKRLKSLEEQR